MLAGRSASAGGISISGNVSVAGQYINPVKFRSNIAYVMQDDALMATSTPREALRFSAAMRLPASTSHEQIETLVTRTLNDLGLNDCADVMIGGALIKGISGGQRKRTSVGVEVITQPSLLFLDEPTSGLDSFAAYNCVKLLKQLAAENCAILCTIHQPSSEVFHLFDIVVLMKAGRVLYQGSVSNIVPHFAACGFDCPTNYNPADFSMFICQTETAEAMDERGLFMTYKTAESTKTSHVSLADTAAEADNIIPTVRANFFRQVYHLTYREALNTKRDVAALIGRFGVTGFLNLLFGLIFLNAGGRDDSDVENFNSHFGALTMITIICMFGAAQSVMLSFPFERPLFLREYVTGTYGAPAYFLGKLFFELPLTFMQMIVGFIMTYFMCSLQGNFIYMVIIGWMLGCGSSSLAVVLGCLVPDVKDVTELAPLLYVPQLLFAGFFIKTSQIPIFLRWAQYLCSLKYAMNLMILTEFDNSNKSCQGGAQQSCHNVIAQNDIKKDQWWVYGLIIIALFLGFRILGGFVLTQKAKRFY